jgi:hypothetical protein
MEGLGSGEILLTSAFIAYESAFSYSQFLPSIMTIGTFVDTPEKINMIRHGEIIGTVFTGGFAVLFALIMRSAMPLILAGIAVTFTLLVYEWALRRAPAWGTQ